MSHRVNVTTSDLDILKDKLSGILTSDNSFVSTLIRNKYPDEALNILSAFNQAGTLLQSRQWTGPILAQVFPEYWGASADGELHVLPNPDASLRYLAIQPLDEEALSERRQITFREEFLKLLLGTITGSLRKQYLPALRWVPHHQVADDGVRGQPLASDIAFGHDLDFLEKQMDRHAFVLEEEWVRNHAWPRSESLPANVIREHSKLALERVKGIIESWLSESAQKIPDSLIALTMFNLCANRALLEYAGLDARGNEAAEIVVKTLSDLNDVGIDEVPQVMEGLSRPQGQRMLRKLLNTWFGSDGSVLSSGGMFSRAMASSEIDLVVQWSVQVQDSYIAGRGHRGGPEEARNNHGTSNHLFIFALGIVAAFYTKAKVPQEFNGKKTPTHSLFPGRNAIASGDGEHPSTHALKVLEQAYGLMFYGNSGWNLIANGVAERARTNSLRRAHLQQLVYFAVKGRPSSQLLLISRAIGEWRESSSPQVAFS